MRHQRNIIEHGPCRRWRAPWRKACRCGLDAWPCPAERMRQEQAEMFEAVTAHHWNDPTRRFDLSPMMTRGQAYRGRWSDRRP